MSGRRGGSAGGGTLGLIFSTLLFALSHPSPTLGLVLQDTRVDILHGGRIVVSNPAATRSRNEGEDGWRFVEELRLGRFQGRGPDVLGDVGHIAVDEQGRIYVLDIGSQEVRVFDRDGRHLRNMVRAGEGPGEINYHPYGRDIRADYMRLLWQPPNRLWVEAGQQATLTVDSLGNHLRRTRWSFPYFPEGQLATSSRVAAADTVGSIYEQLMVEDWPDHSIREFPRMTYIVRRPVTAGHELLAGDTLLIETRRIEMGLPKVESTGDGGQIAIERPVRADARQIAWAAGPGGELWLANRAAYRLHQVTIEGDTIRTVELGTPRPPAAGPVDASEYEPVIAELGVSPEGWIWVRREREDGDDEGGGPVWDLFDNCGAYRGAAFAPFPLASPHIGWRGEVHGVVSDPFGVDYVLRLRLEGVGGSTVVAETCPY
ncbi:hypothetical protein [Candidatus Palauibacter sp.]|uniref:hypothetical protein n=1 Tax=Candidatus Palauibacter sp. TaxID=3101350 RepID=UPI003B015C98